MHVTLSLIFVVFAFVLAAIAAFFGPPIEPHRVRLIAGSLMFYFLSLLVTGVNL